MCPVNLGEGVPSVDEEHLVFELRLRLAPVEEPECTGQRHRIEKVRPDRDHHIHCTGLEQVAADVQLRATGVSR